MTAYGGVMEERNILFANMRIRQVSADAAEGTLRVKAIYDEREYCNILYDGVYYSQLDEKAVGLVISFAEMVSFAEFCRSGSRESQTILVAECGGGNEKFLAELSKRGYRLFSHYSGRAAELLVIAKQISIV